MVQSEVERGKSLKDCWVDFRKIRQACVPLFEESLALVEGALVRGAKLDNGLCQIADALLDELSTKADVAWGRFTILAEGEFFGEMAQIIRLRFPEVSIWNLPIAAHEFGHFVGPELKQPGPFGTFRYPFQEELKISAQESPQSWSFLHEYFADLFATYTLGPAFACTCILLRFDPMTAFQDTGKHPGYAKRFYMIRKTLEKMNIGSYLGIVNYLDNVWQQSLKAAEIGELLQPEMTQSLDGLLEKLYDLVTTELAPIQYKDLPRAYRLSRLLLEEREATDIVEPEHTLVDALNAAWICRIEVEDKYDNPVSQVSRIGTRTVRVCQEIMRRKGS